MKILMDDGTALEVAEDDFDLTTGPLVPTGGRAERAAKKAASLVEEVPAESIGGLIGRIAVELERGVRSELAADRETVGFEIEFGLLLGGEVGLQFVSGKSEGSFVVRVAFPPSDD
ncbi:MAG: hypothetical protein GY788_05470 [bacterium]|nr:hypothetical protein [bacterium]